MKKILKDIFGKNTNTVGLTVHKFLTTEGKTTCQFQPLEIGKDNVSGISCTSFGKHGNIYTATENLVVTTGSTIGSEDYQKLYDIVMAKSTTGVIEKELYNATTEYSKRLEDTQYALEYKIKENEHKCNNTSREIATAKIERDKKIELIKKHTDEKIAKLEKQAKQFCKENEQNKKSIIVNEAMKTEHLEDIEKQFEYKRNKAKHESFIKGCEKYEPRVVLTLHSNVDGTPTTAEMAVIELQDIVTDVDFENKNLVNEEEVLEEWGIFNVPQLFKTFESFANGTVIINALPTLGFNHESLRDDSKFYENNPNINKSQLKDVTIDIVLKEI